MKRLWLPNMATFRAVVVTEGQCPLSIAAEHDSTNFFGMRLRGASSD